MDTAFQRECQDALTLCACEALRRTSRAVTARYEKSLQGTGVRATQMPILVAASLMGPVPVGALADQLVMDRTTLTRNLAGLEAEGLVAITADTDRRIRLVALTPTGRRALLAALRAWRTAQSSTEARYGSSRLRALLGELDALTTTARS